MEYEHYDIIEDDGGVRSISRKYLPKNTNIIFKSIITVASLIILMAFIVLIVLLIN